MHVRQSGRATDHQHRSCSGHACIRHRPIAVQRAAGEVLPATGRLRRVVLRQQVRLRTEANQPAVYRIVACIVEHPFLGTIEHAVRGDGDVPQRERSYLPARQSGRVGNGLRAFRGALRCGNGHAARAVRARCTCRASDGWRCLHRCHSCTQCTRHGDGAADGGRACEHSTARDAVCCFR